MTTSLPFCIPVLRMSSITYMSTLIWILDHSCISAAILKYHSFFVPLAYYNNSSVHYNSNCWELGLYFISHKVFRIYVLQISKDKHMNVFFSPSVALRHNGQAGFFYMQIKRS